MILTLANAVQTGELELTAINPYGLVTRAPKWCAFLHGMYLMAVEVWCEQHNVQISGYPHNGDSASRH